MGNEAGINKLLISFLYGIIQLGIGLAVIEFSNKSYDIQIYFSLGLLFVFSLVYLMLKRYIIANYVK